MNKKHIWHFSRVGGVNRVNLERGSDLEHLDELDQKLWAALSCPVNGLEIDSKSLELIDSDNDQKIRVNEILSAVKWILTLINDPNELLQRRNNLPLSSINTSNELGQILYESAKQILINLGKENASTLSVEETSDTVAIFANTKFNGDGIIIEESAEELDLKQWIALIIKHIESETDRSGKEGIGIKQVDEFLAQCIAYSNWVEKMEQNRKILRPYDDDTEETFDLLLYLKPKIDDFFLRCNLAIFEPEASSKIASISTRIDAINDKNLSDCTQEIENFPIARINTNRTLDFSAPLNPIWQDKLLRFKEIINLHSNKKSTTLSQSEWETIAHTFDSYKEWIAEKPAGTIEELGLKEIQRFINENTKEKLSALIDRDKDLEEEANNIILVDKLVRYYCHIFTLLNNFVTFSDFYSLKIKGIFQAGTLYYDQRSCDLCIKVTDMAKHNQMAAASGICLVYFQCESKLKNQSMIIVAAFTDGDIDDLTLGRNAIFYDNHGNDWDATVIKIIDNSISIRQAFWTPYRKISKLISNQVEKITSSQDEKVHSSASSNIQNVGTHADQKIQQTISSSPAPTNAPPPQPFDIAKFAGIFAAIGLAFGAIGSALASLVGGFMALSWWKMPLAVAGVILAISGPSMILSWLKLRKRNLAPVLDANGWAINAKATINIPFGTTLTHLVKLPENSKLNLKDPFKEKRNPWIPVIIGAIVVIALIVLWYLDFFSFLGL